MMAMNNIFFLWFQAKICTGVSPFMPFSLTNYYKIYSDKEISRWSDLFQQSSKVQRCRFGFILKLRKKWIDRFLVSKVTKCCIYGRTLTICSTNQRLKRSCAIRNWDKTLWANLTLGSDLAYLLNFFLSFFFLVFLLSSLP